MMKKLLILIAGLAIGMSVYAQEDVQRKEDKAEKKEIKAQKKMNKAEKKRIDAKKEELEEHPNAYYDKKYGNRSAKGRRDTVILRKDSVIRRDTMIMEKP